MATMAPEKPTASVMTVNCSCPGTEEQQVDLDAIGITIHCACCGGVIRASFRTLPQALAYMQALTEATGYTA